MKELNNFKKFLNEGEGVITDAQKMQMLKVAEDLEDILKIHHDVEGTRLLAGKMQQRDKIAGTAHILRSLAS